GAVVSNKKKRRPIPPCLLTAHRVGCAHLYHRKLLKEIPYIKKCSEKGNPQQGFFEDADFECIASCLPEGLKDFVWFGYLTGWCKGEVSHLEWWHVDDDTLRVEDDIHRALTQLSSITHAVATIWLHHHLLTFRTP